MPSNRDNGEEDKMHPSSSNSSYIIDYTIKYIIKRGL